MSFDVKENEKLQALIAYVRIGERGALQEPIYDELVQHLRTAEVNKAMISNTLGLGDPRLVKIILDRCPTGKLSDIDPEINAYSILAKARFSFGLPQHRVGLFDLLLPFFPTADKNFLRHLLIEVDKCQDAAFFRRVLQEYPQLLRSELLFRQSFISDCSAEFAKVWAEVFSKINPEDDHIISFARRAIISNDARGAALLLKSGFSMRKHFSLNEFKPGGWNHRFLSRVSSAHGEIQMISNLPSFAEIFRMQYPDLKTLMAGLSPGQQKKAERAMAAQQ